jgi:hypothetical protein
VNVELDKHFSTEEQRQLKMFPFNSITLKQFANGNMHDITFDGLDDDKLYDLFNTITSVEFEDLVDAK